jgi:hypothetical protein
LHFSFFFLSDLSIYDIVEGRVDIFEAFLKGSVLAGLILRDIDYQSGFYSDLSG